jgi:hypothetical protein
MSCAPQLGKEIVDFIAPKRKIKKVYLHCSAASRKDIDANEIHLWHKRRKFSCIGYHFFQRSDGVFEQGRNLERKPSAQKWHNWQSIAICSNGLHVFDFSDHQLNELLRFCKQINEQIPGVTFHGHCEVSAKLCPVYDYKKLLGLDEKGRMVSGGPPVVDIDLHAKNMEKAKILIPSYEVEDWQKSNGLYPDGIVGPKTWAKLIE